MAARRGEDTGVWKAALGASAVLAVGAGSFARSRRRCDRSAGRAGLGDRRRDSDSGGARGERHADGVRVGDGRPDARLSLPRRRLAPSDRPCHGLGRARLWRRDARRPARSSFAPSSSSAAILQVDVVRARASLAASDGAVADGSVSHLVRVRLNGDPIELVPGKKLWVKGWGYAVVDDPVARKDSTGAGDTLAGLRLHLTSAHAGLPAGTDIVLGRVHADLGHIPPAPAPDPGGSGGSGATGTLPDRQAHLPRTHRRRPDGVRTSLATARIRGGTTGTRRNRPPPSSILSRRRCKLSTARERAR